MVELPHTTLAQFDEDGFLLDPDAWSPALAHELAQRAGIDTLTDDHWKLIDTLRTFYFRDGAPPLPHMVCHSTHLDRHCLETLFGHQPLAAWRIAGLPNPGEEVKAYL